MEPLRVVNEGERDVKTSGRPAHNSCRLLRYRCAKVLLAKNRRPWNFPKISLRWGAGASAGSRTQMTGVIMDYGFLKMDCGLLGIRNPLLRIPNLR